ncbi:hypothetical protein HBE96_17375 [Clostridium sp. P21]|uniref:Uncharacterized protein n=1 Tax=Clostridium muellerianum TaxID=2716538 RepID=A0A7Y0HNW1_9CLOT|nr:hypothetical protein [Clostridium muellerianum]NMM64394.1 hypothetical protein [Clostridium muellerianum]
MKLQFLNAIRIVANENKNEIAHLKSLGYKEIEEVIEDEEKNNDDEEVEKVEETPKTKGKNKNKEEE